MHFYGNLSQKKFFDFLSKNLSFTSSWHNQPPPIRRAQFWSPSVIGLTDKDTVTIPCMLAVYYVTENNTQSPLRPVLLRVCIIMSRLP